MANSFSKEEVVAFENVIEGFNDGLVISPKFKKFNIDGTTAERSGNTVWRPQPYIAQSFNGLDQTANFNRNYTQLSVPTSLGYSRSVPLTLSATELRDALQEKRLGKAAMQRLASDINISCSDLAALTGTIVVKRTSAAAGFDDLSAIDDAMNRVGVIGPERTAFFTSANYNAMASNLGARVLDNSKSLTAYEKGIVGEIAGFEVHKLDYGYRLTAAAGVGVTVNGANQRYIPKATSQATTGEISNVDNRYQNLTVGVTSGTIKVGDAFIIAGVNEVHHITKRDTGSPKTFRVTAIITGAGGSGVIQISPPIIAADAGSPTDPELQYQNVTATPATGAAITWLNTSSANVNPFWGNDAFEIMPGKYEPAPNSGLAIMTATTDQGITVVMARQGNINDLSTKYRFDVYYGLVNLQPEMTGIELFSQN